MDELKPRIYKDEEWELFIESPKQSLKTILLNNTNAYTSILIASLTRLEEVHSNMKIILEKLSTININGKFVEISKFFQCFWDCNQKIRSILVFCAYGTFNPTPIINVMLKFHDIRMYRNWIIALDVTVRLNHR